MEFSAVLERQTLEASGNGVVIIPSDWMQGRSAFGGLQAALLLRAMRRLIGDVSTPLRILQVNFIAPVPADKPIGCTVQILRRGRNTHQVEGRLRDGQSTLCFAIGVFGAPRPSLATFRPRQRPVVQKEDGTERYPWSETAEFFQHFSIRWLEGALPFSGAARAESIVMLAHRDPASTTEAHIVALADAVPLAALSLLKEPAARSSLAWTLEFFGVSIEGMPRTEWRMDSALLAASDGYAQQSALLWTPNGQPAALSRQTGVVFA